MKKPQIVTLIGAVLLIFALFLPWVSMRALFIGTQNLHGYETDAIFLGIGGIILIVLALAYKGVPGTTYSSAVILLGLVCLIFTTFMHMRIVNNIVSEFSDVSSYVEISIGTGVFLSYVGSIVSIVGGILKMPEAEKISETNENLSTDFTDSQE